MFVTVHGGGGAGGHILIQIPATTLISFRLEFRVREGGVGGHGSRIQDANCYLIFRRYLFHMFNIHYKLHDSSPMFPPAESIFLAQGGQRGFEPLKTSSPARWPLYATQPPRPTQLVISAPCFLTTLKHGEKRVVFLSG